MSKAGVALVLCDEGVEDFAGLPEQERGRVVSVGAVKGEGLVDSGLAEPFPTSVIAVVNVAAGVRQEVAAVGEEFKGVVVGLAVPSAVGSAFEDEVDGVVGPVAADGK